MKSRVSHYTPTRHNTKWGERKPGRGKQEGERESLTWLQLSASASSALPSLIVVSWLQFPGKKKKRKEEESEKYRADLEI